MAKPKDITELRTELIDAFEMVKQDPRRANQVKEMTNAAGKIIATIKSQLEYSLLRNEQPDIPFMGTSTNAKPLTGRAQRMLSQ